MAVGEGSFVGLGVRADSDAASSSSSTPIDSSNIGFQLLKKHGWKEGTGLGVDEQGRIEPLQAYVKKNKRGLGADKPKRAIKISKTCNREDHKISTSKTKGISKKMKKLLEFEKKMEEKEFDRAFFREFWPDNV
ncbi:meiotically up-regulated protein C1442.13c [Andrographis paniculata]|uniref:meiotically up-regulated protein C1442.13c n=1 Tax=Andrographis paniculata TaxID=175694 RepID=UPI0021E98899|nr:meiotically up-regulated protein C1442.13c [Andrographis paniculata]